MTTQYVAGIDFGTDSVRWLVVNAVTGEEVGEAVSYFQQWAKGEFCKPEIQQYRQHPADILAAMTEAAVSLKAEVGDAVFAGIRAIGIDTTGSTPIAIDRYGMALALRDEFKTDPDAMFILWKDHTSIDEAEEITLAAKNWSTDFTRFVGGSYSSEWYWAKLLRVIRRNPQVTKSLHSFVEMCDWIPAVLTGTTSPKFLKRSRCASGHKLLWNEIWGGLPENKFFATLDLKLSAVKDNIGDTTYTSDQSVGRVNSEWAANLGLSDDVVVAVGAFDSHLGAVGAGAQDNELVKVIGTSTCDIVTATYSSLGDRCIDGICGQVDGSVVPGKIGLEAGQSAFGDYYAWFKNLLMWPVLNADLPATTVESIEKALLSKLGVALENYQINESKPVALDWINGRRTPHANQRLKAAFFNMDLSTQTLDLFHAVVESTAFGAKKINECFEEQGVAINKVIAIGGISKKSPAVMQLCADVLNKPIEVKASEQCCALGAAICSAVAAGLYPTIEQAQLNLASKTEKLYEPRRATSDVYQQRYQQYLQQAALVEAQVVASHNQGQGK
ncbi:MAG: ribulokinase [Reinekea forsetii]|uniref:Ribulokinase n=1 Tax=Reinekea forsetii TaxID=1336806 RepID=A0A2K8KPH9_9GAMM|nr:ribulokinase [Reinekea forsetii]ATX75959.1 ribulokinase [Reinekea forsetii]MDO7641163.1 ribulokinase [Reinekea forsetii]MDO7645699.1 ribulokinase [Reinekea forsetii]MDO7674804.1 ribulokinase [Reinekea forsetii]